MKEIIGNKKIASLIVLILIVVSFCLAFSSANGMVFDVERIISFIGILSGLFGIFSIFINFQVLTEVKNIEEQRLKTISKIKSEIFFRDGIVRTNEAIDKLLTKRTKQDFLQDATLDELAIIIGICQNSLINNKVTKPNSFILSKVELMQKEIIRFKNSKKMIEQEDQQFSSMTQNDFRNALTELKNILDEYVATSVSDYIIKD